MSMLKSRADNAADRYPRGRCEPSDLVVDREVLVSLQRRASLRHLLKGAATTEPVPIACINTQSKQAFKALSGSKSLNVVSWIWPTACGRIVSFSVTANKKGAPWSRILLPMEEAFAQAVYKTGVFYFFFRDKKNISKIFKADLTLEFGQGLKILEQLELDNREEILYEDPEVAFWFTLGAVEKPKWADYLRPHDSLSLSWGAAFIKQLTKIEHSFIQGNLFPNGRPKMLETGDTKLMKERFPLLFDVLASISNPLSRTSDILDSFKSAWSMEHGAEELIERFIRARGNVEGCSDDLFDTLVQYWHLLQLTSEETHAGTRRLWLDGRPVPIEKHYLDLDTSSIGKQGEHYWEELTQNLFPFELGRLVKPNDVPIDSMELWKSLSKLKLDGSEDEAREAINLLLNDALENQMWTIPWGAIVNIDLPGFPHVKLYQIEAEVYAVFIDDSERYYFIASINLESRNWMTPPLLLITDETNIGSKEEIPEWNDQGVLALMMVLATIIRDFMVVEERQTVFGARKLRRGSSRAGGLSSGPTVIYLPRIQYKSPNPGQYLGMVPKVDREKHDVRAHLRKTDNPSQAQVWLAKRYNVTLPKGYTFVRGHSRGGLDPKKQKIYRSRSATHLIYNVVAGSPREPVEWFEFEKDVARYMKALGYEVQHRSAYKSGDGGVDIYAYDRKKDQIWVVQCKCWAPDRPVGPDVIRALQGSLADYPDGARGMVVTTSAFTSGATELAGNLAIELVDGPTFRERAEAMSLQ